MSSLQLTSQHSHATHTLWYLMQPLLNGSFVERIPVFPLSITKILNLLIWSHWKLNNFNGKPIIFWLILIPLIISLWSLPNSVYSEMKKTLFSKFILEKIYFVHCSFLKSIFGFSSQWSETLMGLSTEPLAFFLSVLQTGLIKSLLEALGGMKSTENVLMWKVSQNSSKSFLICHNSTTGTTMMHAAWMANTDS